MDEKTELNELSKLELNAEDLEEVTGGLGGYVRKGILHNCRKFRKEIELHYTLKKKGKRYCPFCGDPVDLGTGYSGTYTNAPIET